MVEINETEKPTEVTAEEIRKVYIKSRDTSMSFVDKGSTFSYKPFTVF